MGQQQLILLVLATIIVGLAIIVGIRAYTENSNKANVDAMMQDATRIANDAQAWTKRPAALGGPAATVTDFTGVDFKDLGYSSVTNAVDYENENGKYKITTAGATFVVTGTGVENAENIVTVTASCTNKSSCITGAITKIGTN